MNKPYIFILLFFTVFFIKCNSSKDLITKSGGIESAIKNSIIDFTHSSIFKKKQAYEIYAEEINDEIYGINFNKIDVNKIFPRKEDSIGSFSAYFPSEYIIRGNKLFIWADSSKSLKIDIINKMSEYKIIDSTIVKTGGVQLFHINEKKKGLDYFFCKKDLRKYKKIKTNKALGHYPIPNLNCE